MNEDEPLSRRSAAAARKPMSRLAAGVLALSVVPAVMGAMAGFGSRWGLWSYGTGFEILRWAAYGGIAVVVLAVAAIIHARPGGPRRGLLAGVLALALGGLTVGIPWANVREARSAPPIHDITTDTEDPPEFVAIAPLRADAPNPVDYPGEEVARQQREAYPEVQPAVLGMGYEEAFERALVTAERQDWQIVEADLDEGRIEATARTFWFGFVDDVVVRVTPIDGRSVVDVRSKSRVGRGDVGTNAERIRAYLDDLTE